MTHPDLTLDDLTPPRRNRVLRLVIMVTMTLCGLMIAAILLSEPRVADSLQSAIGQISSRFAKPAEQPLGAPTGLDAAADTAPVQSAEPDQPVVKPPVSQMPASRIPVRRAGN